MGKFNQMIILNQKSQKDWTQNTCTPSAKKPNSGETGWLCFGKHGGGEVENEMNKLKQFSYFGNTDW